MATLIPGIFDYSSLTTNELERDVLRHLNVHDDWKTDHPFAVLSTRLKKKPAGQRKFEWPLSDREGIDTTNVNGAIADTTTTTITVTAGDAYKFKAGDGLFNDNTGEIFRLTADPANANQIVVERGADNSTAANIGATDLLYGIAPASGDKADSPTAVFTQEGWYYNYTQNMEEAVEYTTGQARADRYTGSSLDEQKNQAMSRFLRHWDAQLFDGKRDQGSSAATGYMAKTGGVIEAITNYASGNITAVDGTLSWQNFKGYLLDIFRHGSRRKLLFSGDTSYTAVSDMVEDNEVRVVTGKSSKIEKIGIDVTEVSVPGGVLALIRHPLWDSGNRAKRLVIVDPADLTIRYFNSGSSIGFRKVQLSNNNKVKKWEFFWDAGLMWNDAKKHALLTGITGYNAIAL